MAFLTVTQLGQLLRQQKLTSTELTELYLRRLKKYDPVLRCVVTLTEELALRQAKRADAEIRAGEYRGPLHGIPWGAKDLMAVPGYATTWGGLPYREQQFSLPQQLPVWEIAGMLEVEAASRFDEVTRNHITEGLNSWPDTFRAAQFVPAVEYLRAACVRTILIQEMERVTEQVDLYVGGRDLGITNLTGHPTVVLPAGIRRENNLELPYSVTMTGQLYGESDLLAVALAYDQVGNHQQKQPPLDRWLSGEPKPIPNTLTETDP